MKGKKKMRILYFTTTLKKGGAEKQLIQLIEGLSRKDDLEIKLLSLFGGEYEGVLDLLKIPYEVISSIEKNNLIRFIRYFKKEVKEFKPDIVHSFLFSTNIVSKISLFFMKKDFKLICSYRGLLKRYPLIRYLEMINYRKADLLISNSKVADSDLEIFRKIEKEKRIIIRNGFFPLSVNEKIVLELKSQFKGKKLVLTVGAFRFEKDYMTNLKVAKSILEKRKDILFLYVGEEGPEKEKVLEFIKINNLEKNIIVLGKRKDLPELMNISDVFFLPTLFESQPNVILEAMYYKLPIVTTNIKGITDINLKARLCPPKNINCMEKSIFDIINLQKDNNSDLEYNRKIIEREFSNKLMIKKYYKLYKKLLNSK